MKNIIIYISLIVGFLILNISLYAQEKRFDSIVELGLPKEVQYVDRKKPQVLMRGVKARSMIDIATAKGNIYREGNILLWINAVNERVRDNHEGINTTSLEDSKHFHDYFNANHPNPGYSSEIIKIGSGRILIVHHDRTEGYSHYYIHAVNNTYDKIVAMTIEYEKKDAVKAKQLAEHILKNVKFK